MNELLDEMSESNSIPDTEEGYLISCDDTLSDDDYHDNENYPILKQRKSLFALLSLSCGLVAVLLCCISFGADLVLPLISFLSGSLQILLAITGIVFFVVDLIKNKAPNGMACAGLVSSVLSAALAILQILYAIIITTSFVVSVLFHAF